MILMVTFKCFDDFNLFEKIKKLHGRTWIKVLKIIMIYHYKTWLTIICISIKPGICEGQYTEPIRQLNSNWFLFYLLYFTNLDTNNNPINSLLVNKPL